MHVPTGAHIFCIWGPTLHLSSKSKVRNLNRDNISGMRSIAKRGIIDQEVFWLHVSVEYSKAMYVSEARKYLVPIPQIVSVPER
jgi:hypothetical protein